MSKAERKHEDRGSCGDEVDSCLPPGAILSEAMTGWRPMEKARPCSFFLEGIRPDHPVSGSASVRVVAVRWWSRRSAMSSAAEATGNADADADALNDGFGGYPRFLVALGLHDVGGGLRIRTPHTLDRRPFFLFHLSLELLGRLRRARAHRSQRRDVGRLRAEFAIEDALPQLARGRCQIAVGVACQECLVGSRGIDRDRSGPCSHHITAFKLHAYAHVIGRLGEQRDKGLICRNRIVGNNRFVGRLRILAPQLLAPIFHAPPG